jgi:hypothetical protein
MNTVETEVIEPVVLPEPRIEELEEEWASLGCSCDRTFGDAD